MQNLYYFSKKRSDYVEIKNFKKKLWTYFLISVIMTSVLLFSTLILFNDIIMAPKSFFYKDATQTKILTALGNGADLNTIKHIYNNMEVNESNLPTSLGSKKNIYPSDIPLSIVLSDTKANLFLKDKPPDSIIVVKLNHIIAQYDQSNPFDKLDNYQKDYFENVRVKLGNSYPTISNDMNKISDDLYNKNQLVGEYLRDSRTSFWLSIAALLLSLSIGIYQIVQNRNMIYKIEPELFLDKDQSRNNK